MEGRVILMAAILCEDTVEHKLVAIFFERDFNSFRHAC